jgi:glycosyltransferase involved in cell wall biosynthesis
MLIVLYAGYSPKPWYPLTFLETGLGGTEQCIMSLANNLLSGTNEVYVVGDVIEGDYNSIHFLDPNEKVTNFVKYRTTENFKKEIGNKKIDWIIAASYIHYLKEFEDLNFDQSIFWVHNTDFYPWWRGKELPNKGIDLLLHPKLTHIVCLTKWHKNKFIEQFPESSNKIQVIGNGLNLLEIFQGKAVPEYTEPKKLEKYLIHEDSFSAKTSAKNRGSRINIKYFEKIPNQFVYTSHAERGLAKVLEDWPTIKQKFPNASLKISTPEYGLEYFEDNFLSLLDNLDDVEFLGTLGRKEYIELLKSSEYWYYPSNYEETFCITALEMLACMVKPITYEAAGLKETLHGFNLENFDDEIDLDAANYWAWRNRWSVVTEKWLKLIKKDTMIDFVYVTTIENNHDYVAGKTNQLNIPNEWKYWIKDGFNAKKFTPSFFKENNLKKNPLWKINHSVDWYTRAVTDGEVGCALSHIDIWQDTYNDSREATLILEDDFRLDYQVPWNEVYELLDKGYDLIYLGRYKVNPEQEEKDIKFNHMWVEPGYSYNTHAYVLSKRGAKVLVENWVPLYKQNLFALDEFFSVVIGKTHRSDIAHQFADLPKLRAAAPKINFIAQEANRNSTEINVVEETQIMPTSNHEILNATDWDAWCQKYINPYLLKGQYQLMTDEIGPNIIEFPLFTEEFCKEIIELAEANTWVTDRHYFYPTTDQTMESLGMQEIYQKVLEQFVYPIWIWFWELDGEDWPKLGSENFIAKYDTLNQGSLGIHHDQSVITLNVKLNDDYEGGGTFIPRYKQTYQAKKIGHAMAHPGQITHKHGGRPVTEGTRYILVTFTNKP